MSVDKVVENGALYIVVKPPPGVSLTRLQSYLKAVYGIEANIAGDSVAIPVTVNVEELGDKANELAEEVINMVKSIDWSKVTSYSPKAKATKRRKRRSRKRSRSSKSKKSSKGGK